MHESRKLQSVTTETSAHSRSVWYKQVAGAALAAGAVTVASDAALGETKIYTSGQTVGAGVSTFPGWQIQTLYFDFFTGNTLTSPILDTWMYDTPGSEGHGVPTTMMLPEGFQFGLARVGPIDALFALSPQGVQANNAQAMVNLVKSGYTDTNGVYHSWTLLKPMKLAANAVIGNNAAFVPAPAREGSTGLNMQTMAAAGAWNGATQGYLGLKFSPNDGSDFYYGWAEVTVNLNSTITLHRFGYNDQLNEPIRAGGNAVIPGDANLDDLVDGADYTSWADHFLKTDESWANGDFSGDGKVDGLDYTIWADHFSPQNALAANAVPEPSSVTLLVMGAAGLGAYRLRRKRQDEAKSSSAE